MEIMENVNQNYQTGFADRASWDLELKSDTIRYSLIIWLATSNTFFPK